jgi:hypothetical protein
MKGKKHFITVAVLFGFLWLLISLAGCSTSLAESDLARIQVQQRTLADNHLDAERWLLRFADSQTRSKHALEARAAIAAKTTAAGTVPAADVVTAMDAQAAADAKWAVQRDNFRDKIEFLSVQEEKFKALLNVMVIFVEGKKNIIELVSDQTQHPPTTQPATQPASETASALSEVTSILKLLPAATSQPSKP